MKSHWWFKVLPDDIINKKCRAVYVIRNPKDVFVSYYHFCTMLNMFMAYKGKFEEFAERFLEGHVYLGPWWEHVNQAVEDNPHALFMHYEELQKKPLESIHAIAKYLGKELNDEEVKAIMEACSFDRLKNVPSANYQWLQQAGIAKQECKFFRKGEVGDWTNYFTPDLSKKFDDMVKEKLKYDKKPFDYGVSHDDFVKIYETKQAQKEQQK